MATKHINRYGRCLNENCEICKDNEILEIPQRKDFICPKCGKPLKECSAPKPKSKLPIYIAAGVLVVGAIVGGIIYLGNNDQEVKSVEPEKENTNVVASTVTNDSLNLANTQIEEVVQNNKDAESPSVANREKKENILETTKKDAEPEKKASTISSTPTNTSGGHSLGYATWTGKMKNGKPHGTGTMTYTTSPIIEERDSKHRMASSGEYVIGEWDNGHLVQGRWYKSDGNKEQINIGRAG